MIKKHLAYSLILLLSCAKEKPVTQLEVASNIEVIEVENDEQNFDFLNMSSLSEGVEYVSLKFNNSTADTLIGNVDYFSVTSNGYVLTDKRITKSIYIFDFNGNLKSKISKVGKGPGEYLKIDDIMVTDTKITIYDSEQQKLVDFDLDAHLLKEYKTKYNFKTFQQTPNATILFTKFFDNRDALDDDMNHRLLFIDADEEVINKAFPFDENLLHSQVKSLMKTFYEFGDSITFIQPLDNTIYRIVNNKVIPRYQIHFKNNAPPADYLEDATIPDKVTDVKNKKYPTLVDHIVENDSHFVFHYTSGSYIYTAIYEKSSGQCKSYIALRNDFDNIFSSELLLAQDGFFYSVLNPSNTKMPDSFERDKTTAKFKNIFNKNGGKMGNPIILKYKL